MPNLIDNFRRRVQQEKEEQEHHVREELPIGIRLHTQVERHQWQPQNEPNADDIPKVVTEAAKDVLESEGTTMANRLLDQAQGGANQERIHRTQHKPSDHTEW